MCNEFPGRHGLDYIYVLGSASVYMTLLDSELTKLVFHAIRSTVRDAIASAGYVCLEIRFAGTY